MDATHQHEHGHAAERSQRPRENWFDEDYVDYWIKRQDERPDERRRREMYGVTFHRQGNGGLFLNLDYVRPVRDDGRALADWAGRDPEARFAGRQGGQGVPGTVEEQVCWLREAGFPTADCLWKEL